MRHEIQNTRVETKQFFNLLATNKEYANEQCSDPLRGQSCIFEPTSPKLTMVPHSSSIHLNGTMQVPMVVIGNHEVQPPWTRDITVTQICWYNVSLDEKNIKSQTPFSC